MKLRSSFFVTTLCFLGTPLLAQPGSDIYLPAQFQRHATLRLMFTSLEKSSFPVTVQAFTVDGSPRPMIQSDVPPGKSEIRVDMDSGVLSLSLGLQGTGSLAIRMQQGVSVSIFGIYEVLNGNTLWVTQIGIIDQRTADAGLHYTDRLSYPNATQITLINASDSPQVLETCNVDDPATACQPVAISFKAHETKVVTLDPAMGRYILTDSRAPAAVWLQTPASAQSHAFTANSSIQFGGIAQ